MKTTYFVATVARYVLVDAENEPQARELGAAALHDLYADTRERLGHDVPITIHTVREATPEEIALWIWHQSKLKAEAKMPVIPEPGDRIRLVSMHDDPDPVPAGEAGTVVSVARHGGEDGWHQIDVSWDSGRTLMLVVPSDEFEIVGD